MRKSEIETYAATKRITPPTYRQLDLWSRKGLIHTVFKGDRHGRYRDWPDEEMEIAFLVARLIRHGLSQDLAFAVARSTPGTNGTREAFLRDDYLPEISIKVGAK